MQFLDTSSVFAEVPEPFLNFLNFFTSFLTLVEDVTPIIMATISNSRKTYVNLRKSSSYPIQLQEE